MHGRRAMWSGIAAVLTVWSCTAERPLPEREPDIVGVLTRMEMDSSSQRIRFLIEEDPGQEMISNKAWVAVTDSTRLLKRSGDDLRRADPEDFQQGRIVTSWFAGPVLQSFPAQTGAEVLVLEPL